MHGGLDGVRAGLRGVRRHAAEANRNRSQVGKVFAECHRHAVRGYYRGMLDVVRVPRYRPPTDEVTLTPWKPFE